MLPPLTLCAYMKKGPNLRWSLIQCSGGDEGDRTPDLLTASQALSQLSYAPVCRSTIRELPRRCKDNFGKTFAGPGAHEPGPASGAPGPPRAASQAKSKRRRPRDASSPRPSARNRFHYRYRTRRVGVARAKTMSDYGARAANLDHAGKRRSKTAGSEVAVFQKSGVWSALAHLAP